MRLLEIFSGTGSVGTPWREREGGKEGGEEGKEREGGGGRGGRERRRGEDGRGERMGRGVKKWGLTITQKRVVRR